MALGRSFLKGMGLSDEQVSAIIEAHTETVDALKAQRDSYKTDAEKLPGVQQELDTLKANSSGGEWEEKYNTLSTEFEQYKTAQTAKETTQRKQTAFRAILKELGIADKRIDTIMKVTNTDSMELDEDGKLKTAEELTEQAKTDWADFIPEDHTKGADFKKPPKTDPGKVYTRDEISRMTAAEINANWDSIKDSLAQKES